MAQYPDRIDFTQLANGKVIVLKIRRDRTAVPRDIPVGHSVKEGFDLEAALGWCEANGYAVRRWDRHDGIPAGARAWRGKPWVIRTRSQIQRKRKQNPCAVGIDFAYDG